MHNVAGIGQMLPTVFEMGKQGIEVQLEQFGVLENRRFYVIDEEGHVALRTLIFE